MTEQRADIREALAVERERMAKALNDYARKYLRDHDQWRLREVIDWFMTDAARTDALAAPPLAAPAPTPAPQTGHPTERKELLSRFRRAIKWADERVAVAGSSIDCVNQNEREKDTHLTALRQAANVFETMSGARDPRDVAQDAFFAGVVSGDRKPVHEAFAEWWPSESSVSSVPPEAQPRNSAAAILTRIDAQSESPEAQPAPTSEPERTER